MGNKTKRYAIYAINILSILVIGFIVGTFSISAYHSYFQADDFMHANSVGVFHTSFSKLFLAAIRFDQYIYLNWQGTYLAMFLQGFLSPLNGLGLQQLQIIMLLNVLLLFATTFFLIQTIFKGLLGKNVWHYVLPFFAIALFSLTAYQAWTEIFYWFSGCVSYSFPLSIGFIGISLFIKSNFDEKGNKIKVWSAALLLFLASGGSLEVSGTSCFCILFLLCFFWKKEKKANNNNVFIFIMAVAGALVNALAPGNFIRHDTYDTSGVHFIKAIVIELQRMLKEFDWLFNETSFWAMLFLLVIVGIILSNKVNIKTNILVLLGGAVLLPFVTAYPVVLAYAKSAYFPNRCKFVLIFIMILTSMFIAILAGIAIGKHFVDRKQKEIVGLMLLLVAISTFSTNDTYRIGTLKNMQTFQALLDGSIQRYSSECNAIYTAIENSEESDVVVIDNLEEIDNFPLLDIGADETFWINEAIATYYGKSSVKVVKYENN